MKAESIQVTSDEIPESYDNAILLDIFFNITSKKRTLDEHYEYVFTELGKNYQGLNKLFYCEILQAIKTIVSCKTKYDKRKLKFKKAIAFLHQDVRLAPNSIRFLLEDLGYKMSVPQILKFSGQIFETKISSKTIFMEAIV